MTKPDPCGRCTTRTPGCPRSPRNSAGSVGGAVGGSGGGATRATAAGRRTAREQHRRRCPIWRTGCYAAESEEAPERGRPGGAGLRSPSGRPRPAAGGGGEAGPAHGGGAGQGDRRQRRGPAPGGSQERQHRVRSPPPRPRRTASSAVATRGRRGGPAGRASGSRSRWPRPPSSGTGRPRRGPARKPRCTAARARVADLQVQWDRLTDAVHPGEVLRAQQQMRAEQLATRAIEEFAVPADELIAGFGPDVPVPPTLDEMAEYQAAKDRGEEVTAPPPMPLRPAVTGAPAQAGRAGPDRAGQGEPVGAGGVRGASRSGTSSWPPSWRTSRRPARTCCR